MVIVVFGMVRQWSYRTGMGVVACRERHTIGKKRGKEWVLEEEEEQEK